MAELEANSHLLHFVNV